MTLVQEPGVRRPSVPPVVWLLVAGFVTIALMLFTSDRDPAPSSSLSRGSGVSVTDQREVAPFTGVELAGDNTVEIQVAGPQSVAVVGDDNLVDQVTTVVRAGQLVIDNTGSFTTSAPMRVAISVPSLDGVVLGGTGKITVEGVGSDNFRAVLGGDGTLVVEGTVERITAVLDGTGTLDLHDLLAANATAELRGTGTIRVHATSTLEEATLTGTGTIVYRGEPTATIHNRGTGTVIAE
jgi:Putative auto-transporter adhesin, head GIN domain